MESKKEIIIIEDNTDVREGLKLLINSTSEYCVTDVFESCEKAYDKVISSRPDIILMDIDLPGVNGIEGTSHIKTVLPKTEIIIITIFENSHRVFEALCAGASGYLTKNSNHIELLKALDEVIACGAPMSTNIARMVISSFHKNSASPLSERETQVLESMVEGKSYKSVADFLEISLGTVKFHIKNIYIKLQVSSREEAIAKARKEKYI